MNATLIGILVAIISIAFTLILDGRLRASRARRQIQHEQQVADWHLQQTRIRAMHQMLDEVRRHHRT